MLSSQIVKKIEDFVSSKPRSVQEIAKHLEKNWRTADRYIEEIEKEFGTISTRVFREGTRGALKIVYWSAVEKLSYSIFQEKLEKEIFNAKIKEDFSAFDIFQHVSNEHKQASLEVAEESNIKEYKEILESTQKQILIFSGNLSFINIHDKKLDLFETFDNLAKRGISIKVLCRVDIAAKENVERLLSLNFKYGKEIIEIHHDSHPLRAAIIDNKLARLKEIKEPTGKNKELSNKLFIFYTIKDKEWVNWLAHIFWKKFSNSIDSNKRIQEMEKIRLK